MTGYLVSKPVMDDIIQQLRLKEESDRLLADAVWEVKRGSIIIEGLKDEIVFERKEGNKKFWKGVAAGSVAAVLVTAAGFVAIVVWVDQ